MKKLKKSKYAFFVEKDNGEYILYSPVSGAAIRIYNEDYKTDVKKILDQEIVEYIDNKFFNSLIEKKILVDYSLDEELLVREIYEESIVKSNVLEIMLIVTRECNFRCVYCGQPHINRVMKEQTYEAVLKFIENQITNYGYRKVIISFFGGEPLLQTKNILKFLEKLDELILDLNKSRFSVEYEAGMTTNGYLLTPNVFENLARYNCESYQISVDGMSEIHNKMRPLVSGAPSWQRIIDNLTYMISTKKNFSVILRTNFNFDVAESLVDFYKYLKENLNDDRIGIYYETIKDQGNELTPNILSETDGIVFDVEIARILKEYGLRCLNSTSRLTPCSYVCYAAKPNFFIIDENQQILRCSFALDDEKNVVGFLDKNGKSVFKKDAYLDWLYKDWLSAEKCRDCKILPLCFGKRCPKSFIENGNACNKDLMEVDVEGLLENYF